MKLHIHEDLTVQTLRTLVRQKVWNDGAREESPDVEWLDVLTDEDPATPPPPPPWRAPTWALPDPGPRPGNPCGVCMEVNDEDGNPLRGHDLGCGGTEQLHWFCSPCIANSWSCPLCWRPHRLCTALPPRETQARFTSLTTNITTTRHGAVYPPLAICQTVGAPSPP